MADSRWRYAIDPLYGADGEVPPEGVIGAWPLDANGEPGEFLANPNHVPIRSAIEELIGSTVYLPVNGDGELIAYRGADGDYVKALTDVEYAAPTEPQLLPTPFGVLLDLLPGETVVRVDPGTDVECTGTVADFRGVRDGTADSGAAGGEATGIPRKGDPPPH